MNPTPEVRLEAHFCTCTDPKCPLNPKNEGCKKNICDYCIRKCLRAGEIPACFFKDIHANTSDQTDWSYAGFAEYLARHSTQP